MILVAILSFATLLALFLREVWPRNRSFALFYVSWVLAYGTLAGSGFFLEHLNAFPPYPMRLMLLLLVMLLLSLASSKGRALWNSIPTERLVAFHVIRAPIGLTFVVGASQGWMAPEFGQRAGWGDMLAGFWALAFILLPALRSRKGTLAWNAVATFDLLLAVGTAALTVQGPFQLYPHAELLRPLAELPGTVVPGCAVPLLFFTHILIFKRLFHK